jgi:membrane-associated phospholipid phosphatase
MAALLLSGSGFAGLDVWLAALIGRLMSYSGWISEGAARMPDLLLPFSVCITVTSWGGFFLLRRQEAPTQWIQACRSAGTAVPVAFVLKELFKWIVGRVNSRVWLVTPALYGFHWLHGGGDFAGFPSGHMAVVTPLCLSLGRAFPHWRHRLVFLLILLGCALIVTGHHFFSDVIAGAWMGWMVEVLVSPRENRDQQSRQ